MRIDRRAFATKICWIALAILAVTLSIWGATRPAAGAETEEFPVWWSPKLEVESLNKIEERLARKFPVHGQFEAERDRNGVRETALIDSCAATLHLTDAGFTSTPYSFQLAILAECRAIELLAEIRPAERSFVHDFVLDETAIPFLPIMFNLLADCFTRREQRLRNSDHAPLTDVRDIFRVEIIPDGKLRYRTTILESTLDILGRGDLNGDGLADLALRFTGAATGGTWGMTSLFLVSRDLPNGILYVLEEDAGNHVCPNY